METTEESSEPLLWTNPNIRQIKPHTSQLANVTCDQDGLIPVHPHWRANQKHFMAANSISELQRNRKFKIWIGNFSSRNGELPKRMRVALAMPPPAYTADANSLINESERRNSREGRGDNSHPTLEFTTNRKRRRRAQMMARTQKQRQRDHENPTDIKVNRYKVPSDSIT